MYSASAVYLVTDCCCLSIQAIDPSNTNLKQNQNLYNALFNLQKPLL